QTATSSAPAIAASVRTWLRPQLPAPMTPTFSRLTRPASCAVEGTDRAYHVFLLRRRQLGVHREREHPPGRALRHRHLARPATQVREAGLEVQSHRVVH